MEEGVADEAMVAGWVAVENETGTGGGGGGIADGGGIERRLAVALMLTAATCRLLAAPPMIAALAVRALRPTSWKQAVGKNSHRRGWEQQHASHRVLGATLPAASSGPCRFDCREEPYSRSHSSASSLLRSAACPSEA